MTSQQDPEIWNDARPFALVDERAVVARWGKSPRTLQRWRAEGYGPPFIRIGGTIHYRVADILEFEARQRRGGRARA